MHRRMLLLFTLFVVTAWFYSSVTHNATENVLKPHKQQIQMLGEADKALNTAADSLKGKDRG